MTDAKEYNAIQTMTAEKRTQILQPFSNQWYDFMVEWTQPLKEMSDEELSDLTRAMDDCTTSNCWYVTWHMIPTLREKIRSERLRRLR